MRVAPACSRSVAVAAASLPVPSCAEAGVTRPRSSLRARPRRQPPRFAFAAEPKPRRPSRWSVRSHLRARGGRAPESRVTPVAPRRRPGPSPPRFRALRFEDACVLLPSASRAARLATRPPVREAFPAAPIPILSVLATKCVCAYHLSRRVLCAYHLVTFEFRERT